MICRTRLSFQRFLRAVPCALVLVILASVLGAQAPPSYRCIGTHVQSYVVSKQELRGRCPVCGPVTVRITYYNSFALLETGQGTLFLVAKVSDLYPHPLNTDSWYTISHDSSGTITVYRLQQYPDGTTSRVSEGSGWQEASYSRQLCQQEQISVCP